MPSAGMSGAIAWNDGCHRLGRFFLMPKRSDAIKRPVPTMHHPCPRHLNRLTPNKKSCSVGKKDLLTPKSKKLFPLFNVVQVV